MTVVNVDPKEVDADIVFSALPADDAQTAEPAFAAAGCAVASNTSSYRMVDDVPLLIPECNYEHLDLIKVQQEKRGWDGYLTTNPNCTTVMFTLPLKPLMKFGIQSVHVASMQAVSGAGYEGVPSMAILGNVIPYIGGEEEKVETEPQKILGTFDGDKIVTCGFHSKRQLPPGSRHGWTHRGRLGDHEGQSHTRRGQTGHAGLRPRPRRSAHLAQEGAHSQG